MNAARYLVGFGAMAVALVPVLIGSRALCRRLLPRFVGPAAWLATAVVALTIVIVASEVLGSVGLFALLPVVATFAGVGFLAWWIGFRGSPARDAVSDSPRSEAAARAEEDRTGRWGTFAAIAAVALVTAEWSIRTVDSLRYGMMGIDTLWYHLPVAARFAESGRTWDLHYVDGQSLTVFYPAVSELLHGLGIVFLGTDLLSPLLNTFWLALALLAGWCVGRPYGLARVTLIGSAFLLATPVLALLQPGGGMNDVVGLALFLAAAAILVTATNDPRARLSAASIVCAALAAGLALGTKYTFIAPVGAMGIGVVAIGERGERLRRALLWFAAIGLAGGYWYLRNFIAVGNPLPPLQLDMGPVRLPSIPFEGTESVATYLFNRRVWGDYFLPGLRDAFGPAWVVLIATGVGGVVLGFLLGRGRVIRMLAVVGGVCLGAYVFTPQVLGNFAGFPVYFGVNLRYASPALAIGVVVLPLALDRFGRRAAYLLLVLYGGALLVTQLDSGIWQRSGRFSAPPTGDTRSFVISLAIGAGGLLAATAWLVLRSRARKTPLSRTALGAAALLVVVIGCAGGYLLSNEYSDRRYKNAIVLPEIYRWARDIQHSRIAIVGTFLQYPLYGTDSSNFVQYIAVRGEGGTSTAVTDCATWRRALNEGDYRYVMITTSGFPFPNAKIPGEQVWTGTDPADRLLIHETYVPGTQAWLYRIDGRLDPARCGEN
jgi:hypothetical protein